MNRKTQDSTDELLRALRASLDEEADVSPDIVFSDRTDGGKGGTQADEEMAAFDSYMAALLDGVVSDDRTASVPKTPKAKKSKKSLSTKTKKKEMVPSQESEADVLTDMDAPEGAPQAEPVATIAGVAVVHEEQDIPEPTDDFEEETAQNDPQVELPDEVLGEARPQIDAVFVTEQPDIPLFEPDKIEQLRIPTDSFVSSTDAAGAETALDEVPAEHEPVEPDEEEYLPVEGFVSETAQDIAEQEKREASLHELPSLQEGDIVLDADDETPHTEETAEEKPAQETAPAAKPTGEKATAVPVASPLDAVRQANARAEQEAEEVKPRPKQSPLDAIAAGRMGGKGNVTTLGGSAAFGRPAGRERALTDEDVALLLDLGYENTLSHKIGAQRVEEMKHRRTGGKDEAALLSDVYGCHGEEYTSHAQDDSIKATYQKQLRAAKIRQGFSFVLVLLIALADLFPLFRDKIPYDLSFVPTTGLCGALGMLLLLVAALIGLPYLKRGMVSLFRLSPKPSAIPVLMLVATWLYDALCLFDAVGTITFNIPAALALFLLAMGERMRVEAEGTAFSVISTRARKIVLDDMDPKKKKVIRDGHVVKIINDDADRPWRRVRQAEQLQGYFKRMGEASDRHSNLAPLLSAAVFSSITVAIVVLLLQNDLRLAATALLFALLLTLPSSALIAYAYSMLLTTKELAKRGCAIVGDSAVDEYSKPSILLFDDAEMFRSKSSTEITIKGGGDNRKYIRYAKRLFHALGGTLRHVTTTDLSDELYEDRVEILRVMDEGVEACIDGKAHVLAGTSAFMIKNGIRVPDESAELLVRRHVESCILYLAFEGKLRLGYEIDYRISGRFEQAVAELAKHGTDVAIETYDPDIHAEFLSRSRGPEMPPVRVIKPVRFEKTVDATIIDSGVVATRSARDIARATDACRRLSLHDRFVAGLQWLMLLIGCGMALALSFATQYRDILLLIFYAFPLIWCIPCALSARKTMKYEQDQESENDNRN